MTNSSNNSTLNLSIDTTGEYFLTGKIDYPQSLSQDITDKRNLIHRQFAENVNLFLKNKDRILNDNRMFLTPVEVDNAMSITGHSGFWNATLGVYIEWWMHHSHASFDADGDPIWYISGSPLSGAHACCSVDRENNKKDSRLKGRFRDVWESFMEVNAKYAQVQGRELAYTIQEVIDILQDDHIPS